MRAQVQPARPSSVGNHSGLDDHRCRADRGHDQEKEKPIFMLQCNITVIPCGVGVLPQRNEASYVLGSRSSRSEPERPRDYQMPDLWLDIERTYHPRVARPRLSAMVPQLRRQGDAV